MLFIRAADNKNRRQLPARIQSDSESGGTEIGL